MLEYLSTGRKMIHDESAAMGRWILASLLALNGAGSLAVLNAIDKLTNPFWPAFFFVAGMLLALLSGTLAQYLSILSITPVNEAAGYWLSVLDDGILVDELHNKLVEKGNRIERLGRLAAVPGWLSSLLFIAGAIALAFNVIPRPTIAHSSAATPASTTIKSK